MDALRVRKSRRLETPIWYYQDPGTARWITVVGTYPRGHIEYYIALQNEVHRLESGGPQVHYEPPFTVPTPEDELAKAHPDEREVISQLEEAETLRMERLDVLGWVHIRAGLQHSEHWQPHEVTALQLVRFVSPLWARPRARHVLDLLQWPDTSRRGPAKYRLYEATVARLAARQRDTGQVSDHCGLLRTRADTAVGIVCHTNKDVVLVWDVEVLPMIAPEFARLGFVRQHIRWLQVGQLPDRGGAAACRFLGVGPAHPRNQARRLIPQPNPD